jgi:hypothetical protein
MSKRHFPVRPDLDQLKHQAKDLLRAIHAGDAEAIVELQEYHPERIVPGDAKLADAQLVLARSYGAPSWPRLAQSCQLIDAIWKDDVEAVRRLVLENPNLLSENAGIRNGNWGPPLSYAANLGRDRIITMLRELGATDLQHAIDRAVLQSRIGTARMLHGMMGGPRPPRGALGTPAYSLSVSGTEFLFEIGAEMLDEPGGPGSPVEVVLCTDGRNRDAKHRILELYAEHGFAFPDTPTMAVHRGRIDLLAKHLQRDRALLERTFSYGEMFPPELGCRQPAPGKHDEGFPRTPLAGATLLHLCVEFEEIEIAQWLLAQGMNPDAPAATDEQGFGGYTALYGTVVCYPNFWMNFTGGWASSKKPYDSPFARLLLDHGANPNARASLRELGYNADDPVHERRDVTPIGWGEAFSNRIVVSEPAMRMIAERGGHR